MTQYFGYEMTEPGAGVRFASRTIADLDANEALVEVAGCGVCHTDIGFLYEGVRTRHALPLILGHEISGRVVAVGANHPRLLGEAVVVPAVLPCGSCEDCAAGRPMICRHQVMPGNDVDGGFATHVVVPASGLAVVPGAPDDPDAPLRPGSAVTLSHLAVIADAVSTPFQAVRRSGLSAGDVAVVVGLGGVGSYAVQIARAMGAHVVGIDIDAARREAATGLGASMVLDPTKRSPRELRESIRGACKEVGWPQTRWVLLECSGAAAGQQTAFGMLVPGATLMVVGFTRAKLELRLSNLMAMDARAVGTWGCAPELYPEIIEMVLDGRIDVVSDTDIRHLDEIGPTLEQVRDHHTRRRVVLTPRPGAREAR